MKNIFLLLISLPILLFAQGIKYDTLTDARDGQKYKTVVIGNQTWMAENLNYKTDGSKCYDNELDNCQKYGQLYTWKESKEVCPEGWMLPFQEEWLRLADFAGGGKRLKAKGVWREKAGDDNTDDYGFSMLPGGLHYAKEDNYAFAGENAFFWTSSSRLSARSIQCIYTRAGNNKGGCEEHITDKLAQNEDNRASIRCILDKKLIKKRQYITEIKALLKANKLEECLDRCTDFRNEFGFQNDEEIIIDLCKNQLVNKIKKLQPAKIKSARLMAAYYDDDESVKEITGFIFQNDGKMVLMSDFAWNQTFMVQYSGYVGNCRLRPDRHIPFYGGYGKYLGEKTYTTVTGARQSVPNYKLLWCND